MSFNHPALLAGLALVALPLLIHLINLLRHRRVQWGAMEFLLAAQKKNRRWIVLKQMLLLLSRMAAVVVVVLIVAQAVLPHEWIAVMGGSQTHHVIVLDDSFSMSDRRGDETAFERAKAAIRALGSRLAAEKTSQQVTLITYSAAASGAAPLMVQVPIDSGFQAELSEVLSGVSCSQMATGPEQAVESLARLPAKTEDETRLVYIVSDFRAPEWNAEAGQLQKRLRKLTDDGAGLDLVQCVEQRRPNLAITLLQPEQSTRAADVPLHMRLAVRNFGDVARDNVTVRIYEDDVKKTAVLIDEIGPGQVVERTVRVRFPTAGAHRVTARLDDDAVLADNERFCVLDLPEQTPVLIIDQDPDASDAQRLAWALNPAIRTKTGISPRIERPVFLRDNELDGFATVYLLNFDRIQPASVVERLEKYVADGGGLGFFVGENTDGEFITKKLYRNGDGVFPLPLAPRSVDLPIDSETDAPDLDLTDHPVFSVFKLERNSFLDKVWVERYFPAAAGWTAPAGSAVKVIARLRNGAPLTVERAFGKGRVVAFLTKASPVDTSLGRWNNWGEKNPSYIVAMQQLQAYLSAGYRRAESHDVGAALVIRFSRAQYDSTVIFKTPHEEGSPLESITLTADEAEDHSELLAAALGKTNVAETGVSGVYRATLLRGDGRTEQRLYGVNVDAEEGDLSLVESTLLATVLEGIPFRMYQADALGGQGREQAGSNLSAWLLLLMVGLMIGEQWLAYSASYHASERGGPR